MEGNVHGASRQRAWIQWQGQHDALASRATVELIEPQPGLPDLVFTANAAVLLGCTAVLARFFHSERHAERHSERHSQEPWFLPWLKRRAGRWSNVRTTCRSRALAMP